jgi:HEAT repeat protein
MDTRQDLSLEQVIGILSSKRTYEYANALECIHMQVDQSTQRILVPLVLRKLAGESADLRELAEKAIRRLGGLTGEDIPLLIELFCSSDHSTREWLLDLLDFHHLANCDLFLLVIDSLLDITCSQIPQAVDLLIAYSVHTSAEDKLLQSIKVKDSLAPDGLRFHAVQILGDAIIGAIKLPELANYLSSNEGIIRRSATIAALLIGAQSCTILLSLLQQKEKSLHIVPRIMPLCAQLYNQAQKPLVENIDFVEVNALTLFAHSTINLGQVLRNLIECLDSARVEIRRMIPSVLVEYADHPYCFIDRLVRSAFEDSDDCVQFECRLAIKKLLQNNFFANRPYKSEQIVEVLGAALAGPSDFHRIDAANYIADLVPESRQAVSLLAKAFESEQCDSIRRAMIGGLMGFSDSLLSNYSYLFLASTFDPDSGVRHSAFIVLGWRSVVPLPQATRVLQLHLTNSDLMDRYSAASALLNLGYLSESIRIILLEVKHQKDLSAALLETVVDKLTKYFPQPCE